MKYKDFKAMSKNEMKEIKGGRAATVTCNDGTEITSTNNCSNSVGVCNAHGGFKVCTGAY